MTHLLQPPLSACIRLQTGPGHAALFWRAAAGSPLQQTNGMQASGPLRGQPARSLFPRLALVTVAVIALCFVRVVSAAAAAASSPGAGCGSLNRPPLPSVQQHYAVSSHGGPRARASRESAAGAGMRRLAQRPGAGREGRPKRQGAGAGGGREPRRGEEEQPSEGAMLRRTESRRALEPRRAALRPRRPPRAPAPPADATRPQRRTRWTRSWAMRRRCTALWARPAWPRWPTGTPPSRRCARRSSARGWT